MSGTLVPNPNQIRLAMLGIVEGNGHPYSWSAIINGRYDRDAIARCGYPVIGEYLGAQPPDALGIPGATVTHVWCERRSDAEAVARATSIAHILDRPTDAIGQVDAVIIPTDAPAEHLENARPFIETGIPVFVDKPLTNNLEALRQFTRWQSQGKPILSMSCMRYAIEFEECRRQIDSVGELRMLTMTMCKTWERYGIHALEGLYPFLEPGGWLSASDRTDGRTHVVHLRHRSGVEAVVTQISDLYGAFACMQAAGTRGYLTARFSDTFTAFKRQLSAMVAWLRTGTLPFGFDETLELMLLLIAAEVSAQHGGREVLLAEFPV